MQLTNKKTAWIWIEAKDYKWFANELVEPVTFYFRVNAKDIFSHTDTK